MEKGPKATILPQKVTNTETTLINQLRDKINTKVGTHHDSFEVVAVSS